MYHIKNTIEIDKSFILKEDETTYHSRCSGELLKNPQQYRFIDLFSGCRWVAQRFLEGRYLHPEQHRPITHREAARFQSFPDSFSTY